MPIRPLPDQLVNQIAAGEVIERPAAVIKELVENSLDAGAASVAVEVERGGLSLMRVRDDGEGIAREELPLAVSRHATSKIGSLGDLERVGSYGFRGEALPSIVSVSRFRMVSRHADGEDHGWELSGDGVPSPDLKPAPHPVGTTIEVRDLFYNTPARRKFVRAESTEFRHIERLLRRLALARGPIAFRLQHNGRSLFSLKPADSLDALASRVETVCADGFMDNAVPIDEQSGDLRLWGWVALPSFSTGRTDQQYFYVNARPVTDRLVAHAIRRAFADVLHGSRHPAFVLFLDLDPAGVDVNVHPGKAEVRFRDAGRVHDFLFGTLNRLLRAVRPDPGSHHAAAMPTPEPAAGDRSHAPVSSGATAPGPVSAPRQFRIAESRPAASAWSALPVAEAGNDAAADTDDDYPLGRALGQVADTFVLAENRNGLIVVDMHAGHERVLFERMKSQLDAGEVASQRLLVPETVAVSEDAADLAESRRDWLRQLGIEVDRSAPESLLVRAVPPLLLKQSVGDLLRSLLGTGTELDVGAHFPEVRDAQHRVLADMACRAAIRSGRRLSLPEMDGLLRDMEQTENAGQCSHGRPTWVCVDHKALDRLFLRGR